MDDIPGPGRILDKYIYQRGGRVIERFALRLTISSLPPAHIIRYFKLGTHWFDGGEAQPLSQVIESISEQYGPPGVAGLKGLVKQAKYVIF